MVKHIKCFAAIILVILLSCQKNQEDFTVPQNNLSDFEQKLVGSWQYVRIEAAGNQFRYADQVSEPGYLLLSTIGQRAELERRIINYSADKLYQLRWTDRGRYQLGTDGEANWQPDFGYWYYDVETNRLIHNEGLFYKMEYTISISGNIMTRVSNRVMSSSYDAANGRLWNRGQIITYKEIFQRLD